MAADKKQQPKPAAPRAVPEADGIYLAVRRVAHGRGVLEEVTVTEGVVTSRIVGREEPIHLTRDRLRLRVLELTL